jgi:D-glycero-D-manno-heptose 1,7-bisphosphate phosphatase
MLPGVAAAIARLNEARYPVFVTTNQSGVGRKYFPESVVTEVNALMGKALEMQNANLTAIYYCAHATGEECDCRKPKTGMAERAAKEHKIDLSRSYFIGDRRSDIEFGHNAGGRSILVRTGYGEGEFEWHLANWARKPDFVALDLSEAVDWILRKSR